MQAGRRQHLGRGGLLFQRLAEPRVALGSRRPIGGQQRLQLATVRLPGTYGDTTELRMPPTLAPGGKMLRTGGTGWTTERRELKSG
jgi:hypothetical protein